MAAQFQVDTDRIAAAAGDVARISADIEGQVAVMMARLTSLQDAWTGSASAQFQGVVAVARYPAAGAHIAGLDRAGPRCRRVAVRRGRGAGGADVLLSGASSVGGDGAEDVEARSPAPRPDGGEDAHERRDEDEARRLPARDGEDVDPVVDERALEREREREAEHHTQHRAEQRDRDRLQAQHRAQLASASPTARSRPISPTRSMTERARVLTMPSTAHDDGQAEEGVDDEEQLVDRRPLLRGEGRLVVDAHRRQVRDDVVEGRLSAARSVPCCATT